MEGIAQAHQQLEQRGNLSKTITDVQEAIDILLRARESVVSSSDTAVLTFAKLKQPVKAVLEKLDDDLKEVNKGLNHYQKALDKRLKKGTLPTASSEPLAKQPELINRAIVMHLLREGKFDVANALVDNISKVRQEQHQEQLGDAMDTRENEESTEDWLQELAGSGYIESSITSDERKQAQLRGRLQQSFTEMYHVLNALRNEHDLGPAIKWASDHSNELEKRGSNLEFELSRLKFIELYTSEDLMSDDPWEGPMRALAYARSVFPAFSARYSRETSSLMGSLAYVPDLSASPYTTLFYNPTAWEEASDSFTREFCGLLGLSDRSPLYTAVTAGGIALPTLEKVERVMAQTRGQWTSVNELPVETPLPDAFKFHSIFVCPVSKEQATDENPPLMLPCGHVIAQESLDQHSRGKNRMKCPYCPVECAPRDAKRIFI